MKGQAAIEFLTTYAFLFLIIGVMIAILFFFSSIPQNTLQSQCSGFAGLYCSIANFFSNTSISYSLATLALSNAQPVPVYIDNISVQVKGITGIGACTPNYLLPGAWTSCLARINVSYAPGVEIQGFYAVGAKICNAPSAFTANCIAQSSNVSYSGSFAVVSRTSSPKIYGVVALQGSQIMQLGAYSWSGPGYPSTYKIKQNGDFSGSRPGFAYGTAYSSYIGSTNVGYSTETFPSIFTALSANNIACMQPFNTSMSIAYTTAYVPGSSPTVNVVTDNAIEIYYRIANTMNPDTPAWSNVINGAGWIASNPKTAYGPYTLSVDSGNVIQIAVQWANTCGNGLEAVNITGVR